MVLPTLLAPNLVAAFDQFDKGRQQRLDRLSREALQQFGPAALRGDADAINQLFANNPNAAIQFSQLQEQRQSRAAANARAERAFQFQQSQAQRAQANADRAFQFQQSQFEFEKSKFQQQMELNAQKLQNDIAKANQKAQPSFKDVQALRKEFVAMSKDFIQVRNSWARIQDLDPNSATGADDATLVFSFMKMLDPTSVVREGEQATARNSAGVPESIRGIYNNLIGGGQLSPAARTQMKQSAQRVFQKAEQIQEGVTNTFDVLAQKNNIDPDDVAIELGIPIPDQQTQTQVPRLRFNPETNQLEPAQ